MRSELSLLFSYEIWDTHNGENISTIGSFVSEHLAIVAAGADCGRRNQHESEMLAKGKNKPLKKLKPPMWRRGPKGSKTEAEAIQ